MAVIISLISGKGGVGKTTVALNLASSLEKIGYRTIVFEGNVTSPTASIYLGYLPAEKTVNRVMENNISLENAVLTHESGVRLLTNSLNISDLGSDYKKAFGLVKELKGNVDVVLIDAGAGLGEEARLAINASDYVVVVTNPELPAAIECLRAVRLTRAMEKKVAGIIVNKINHALPQLPIKEIEDIAEAKVIGEIKEDKAVHESFAYNYPVVHFRPKAKVSNQFKILAASLVGEEIEVPDNGFVDRLSFWMHKIGLKYLP